MDAMRAFALAIVGAIIVLASLFIVVMAAWIFLGTPVRESQMTIEVSSAIPFASGTPGDVAVTWVKGNLDSFGVTPETTDFYAVVDTLAEDDVVSCFFVAAGTHAQGSDSDYMLQVASDGPRVTGLATRPTASDAWRTIRGGVEACRLLAP
jgi:hypothetical protein